MNPVLLFEMDAVRICDRQFSGANPRAIARLVYQIAIDAQDGFGPTSSLSEYSAVTKHARLRRPRWLSEACRGSYRWILRKYSSKLGGQ